MYIVDNANCVVAVGVIGLVKSYVWLNSIYFHIEFRNGLSSAFW